MSPTTLDDLKKEFGRGSKQKGAKDSKNHSKLSDMIMNDMRKVHGIYSGEGDSIFHKKTSVKQESQKMQHNSTFTSQKRSQASCGAGTNVQNAKMNSLMMGTEESAMQTLKTPKSVSRSLFSSTFNKKSTIAAYGGSTIQMKKVDYKSKLSHVSPAATIEEVKKNIK